MIAVDIFIKLLKVSRFELDLKTYKHCRTYPHSLFNQDDDLYEEEESCDDICQCCVVKNDVSHYSNEG